jgi:16S rRNA (guanine1207-N2)-methyltransferase
MADVDKLRQDIQFEANLHGKNLLFRTTWGLFSPKEIDPGTKLLANCLKLEVEDDNLDLGCGYGPIGLTMATLCPKGRTHLVDKDFVAVLYAERNANINALKNVEVYLSNGFSEVPDFKFNNIACNLPAKSGKEQHFLFFSDAKGHLKPGGRLWVVTVNGLIPYMKRTLIEVFGNYEKAAHNRHFTLSTANLN